ncbi:hypothetical protein [Bacteroides xylanisolvens]|uniref:hypothetical protein n=1 Tax=Bacteroides xylanisolvens TaxID=371601 RepID=UPI0023B8F703|nr:hypothetical protein [Bacteroides xylanisolvens]MDF0567076.1 hypothetical protein [Bacteroides xylanisolvens]
MLPEFLGGIVLYKVSRPTFKSPVLSMLTLTLWLTRGKQSLRQQFLRQTQEQVVIPD